MEHISKVELVGRVGRVEEQIINNNRLVRFSLLVETKYGDSVHSTWFNCVYWGNVEVQKGTDIHLNGRLVGQQYTDQDGNPRQYLEVKVNQIF